jgi:hypothetical protein
MGAWNTLTAPKYVNYSLPPTNLASGAPNLMAWELDGSANGGRDVYTNNDDINNGIVGGMYDPDGNNHPEHLVASTTTGFTLEAAFSVFDVSSFRTIIAKEGLPGTEMGSLDPVVASLPTMALKVRGPQFEGDPDQGKLQIELFDGSGALKSINSGAALQLGEWYYAAVVNDGTTLSLYLDENDGNGYELEGSIPVNGALYQGPNYNNADWDKAWSIGKGVYGYSSQFENGIPADFFNGLIDEIRLTNEALAVEDFLFYQEPAEDGDFNDDGTIDGADFLMWQRGQSTNGLIGSDLQLWKDTFGSATVAGAPIPEPATLGLACLAIVGGLMARRRFLQS